MDSFATRGQLLGRSISCNLEGKPLGLGSNSSFAPGAGLLEDFRAIAFSKDVTLILLMQLAWKQLVQVRSPGADPTNYAATSESVQILIPQACLAPPRSLPRPHLF